MMSSSSAETHQFDTDSGLTYREIFDLAFKETFILHLQALACETDGEGFLETLQRAAYQAGFGQGREVASGLPSSEFAAYKTLVRQILATPVYRNALVLDYVEDNDGALEVRITECLWERTFREAGATDVGYATMCHADFGVPQGFNPKIRLVRTMCLMQGDDHCNHRWVLEE
jgi:hypothetical protein